MDMQETLGHQLEELNLVKCSILPDELFAFVLPPEDSKRWSNMLDNYPDSLEGASSTWLPSNSNVRFEIGIEKVKSKLWFEIELPREYPRGLGKGADVPSVSVKGEDISRDEQERWSGIVGRRWKEVVENDAQYPVYDLVCLHLLPQLHAEYESMSVPVSNSSSTSSNLQPPKSSPVIYHALFTSHHLISPHKRRSLQQWTSELSLSGFAKLGYPGVIYCEGIRENVEEFVDNVKSMQWLALRLRFIEPLPVESSTSGCKDDESKRASAYDLRRWVEFEKVGEVVQEMKRLKREQYVLEMGIGSVGAGVSAAK